MSSGSPEELSSPIYATAVGLVLRNIDEMDSNFFHSDQETQKSSKSIFETWTVDLLGWLANEKNNKN